ncbi:MAG: HAMP domain-containing histidine kinase [Oscillospiraceae bacterium]|nr:HAMP domain-containing histidine kinase [Oscillospiraceae bacterium]
MKHHVVVKFLAVALCALALLTAVTGGLGLVCVAALEVEDGASVQSLYEKEIRSRLEVVGQNIILRYASENLGNCPERLLDAITMEAELLLTSQDFRPEEVSYELQDESGKRLVATPNPETVAQTITLNGVTADYYTLVAGPVMVESREAAEEALRKAMGTPQRAEMETAAASEPVVEDGGERSAEQTEALSEEDFDSYVLIGASLNSGKRNYYACREEVSPSYTLVFRLSDSAFEESRMWELLELCWRYQNALAVALGVGLLLFAALAVYLCTAAGRSPGSSEVKPAGLNCIPLELYAGAVLGIILLFIFVAVEGFPYLMRQRLAVSLSLYAYGGYFCCLSFVGFCYACAAQFKAPDFYWWRHSLTGLCWKGLVRCWKLVWQWGKKLAGFAWSIGSVLLLWGWKRLKKLWHRLGKCFGKLGKFLARLYHLLPLTWQWLLIPAFFAGLFLFSLMVESEFFLIVTILGGIGAVLYGANVFGTLLEAARRMRAGDLEVKVDDRLMLGAYRDFAAELNGLNEVVQVAAQKQMKSERMRTELITNVSHDIKTPLTSIINYVDLLQKPHTEEEGKSYLEVLSRQSGRMKKLIDDLIELSKASTGNIPVELTKVDAVEAVNQALGEFTDKLTAAELTPVFRQPEEPLFVHADGRLAWRAMSNLLSNAVKYAQPGTRFYIDMVALDGKVCISFKNISRAALNVSAEELMERFVRGEASRNQEGSGLGLNIAKSMMELQHGDLDLLVDGDLFKATLVFPQETEA